MHRLILAASNGQIVDHINSNDTLDNRRANLRFATKSQNDANKVMRKHPSITGFRGVYPTSWGLPFRAQINFENKLHYIGKFSDAVNAALAYDEAAILVHGEFAVLNSEMPGAMMSQLMSLEDASDGLG